MRLVEDLGMISTHRAVVDVKWQQVGRRKIFIVLPLCFFVPAGHDISSCVIVGVRGPRVGWVGHCTWNMGQMMDP